MYKDFETISYSERERHRKKVDRILFLKFWTVIFVALGCAIGTTLGLHFGKNSHFQSGVAFLFGCLIWVAFIIAGFLLLALYEWLTG